MLNLWECNAINLNHFVLCVKDLRKENDGPIASRQTLVSIDISTTTGIGRPVSDIFPRSNLTKRLDTRVYPYSRGK